MPNATKTTTTRGSIGTSIGTRSTVLTTEPGPTISAGGAGLGTTAIATGDGDTSGLGVGEGDGSGEGLGLGEGDGVAAAAAFFGTGWIETYFPSQIIGSGAYRHGVK
jgi:hypothetical protein